MIEIKLIMSLIKYYNSNIICKVIWWFGYKVEMYYLIFNKKKIKDVYIINWRYEYKFFYKNNINLKLIFKLLIWWNIIKLIFFIWMKVFKKN